MHICFFLVKFVGQIDRYLKEQQVLYVFNVTYIWVFAVNYRLFIELRIVRWVSFVDMLLEFSGKSLSSSIITITNYIRWPIDV